MDEVILTLHGIIKNMGVNGLDGIRYMVLIITMISNLFNTTKVNYYNKLIKLESTNGDVKDLVTRFQSDVFSSHGIFNFQLDESFYGILYAFKNRLVDYKENISNISSSIISDIFKFHFSNDTLLLIKEYYKFYLDQRLTKWIVNLSNVRMNNDRVDTVLDGNVKINSFLESVIEKGNDNDIDWSHHRNKVTGIQSNSIIYDFSKLNVLRRTSYKVDSIFKTDVLLNDLPTPIKKYDIIFYDFPSDVRNITHASCCSKVKNLKIRGTKYEPLLLQFVMTSLNQQGRAYVIVPDSLLFNDAIQHVQTRKYLVENFNIKKIISIDESFYRLKGNKHSIIWFENSGKTAEVKFSKLTLNNDAINESEVINIPVIRLEGNLYSLYHKVYLDVLSYNQEIDYVDFGSKFELTDNAPNLLNLHASLIGLDKYYKNDKSVEKIKVIEGVENKNFDYYITCKDKNDFLLNFLEYTIRTKHEQFTKGKMNQFDLDKIKSIKIPMLNQSKQDSVNNYIKITNNILQENINNVGLNNRLKNDLLNTIPNSNLQTLESICELVQDSTNKGLVGVIKNGLSAGSVYIVPPNQALSNNSYYLRSKDDTNIIVEYIYQYLKHIENSIREKAALNIQPLVNKSTLLSLQIPIIDTPNQKHIVSYCNDIDNDIYRYQQANEKIKEKDIMGTVIKLYNL